MSKYLIIFFIVLECVQISAQDIRFQKTYSLDTFISGTKNREVYFYDVQTLRDDGFATLGFLTDSTNRSEGFIALYDCEGNVEWMKSLGNSGAPTNTNAGIVEADNGDIVFSFNLGTGFFRASILCGRISKNGQVLWMKRIGNNTEFGRDIVKTRDGGFVIAGSTGFYGTDNTADDIYLFKLDANGVLEWSKTFGNPNGTYDEAFAIKTDSRDRLIITGRCIADATFQAFILQADGNGNVVNFKTYGYNNQRTNAFDLIVDDKDNYLITGFTTILETDHSSPESDPFLIKVDSAMNTLFANVYEVSLGNDFSTIGEGLCQLPNGDYAIGVSSSSFTAHNINGPNAPNKNALYIIQNNGNLRKAFIYNRHGSQYTRVRNSSFGTVLLSGFTRAYTDKVHSQGLIIKTDKQFLSGCNDIDVTNELNVFKPEWQIADFTYLEKSGFRTVDYISYKDSSLRVNTICFEAPFLNPDFEGPDTICPGEAIFTDFSSGPGNAYWIVDNDTIRQSGDLIYNFIHEGLHRVSKVLQFSCLVKSQEKFIVVSPSETFTINDTICAGDSILFNQVYLNAPGKYTFRIPGTGSECDKIYELNLFITNRVEEPTVRDTQYFCEMITIGDSTYTTATSIDTFTFLPDCKIKKTNITLIQDCDCIVFPNTFTPDNNDLFNDEFLPFNPCDDIVTDYKLEIYNRWGAMVFNSADFNRGWDGIYKGEQAPMETYLYISEYKIRYLNETPLSRAKKGTITLIR